MAGSCICRNIGKATINNSNNLNTISIVSYVLIFAPTQTFILDQAPTSIFVFVLASISGLLKKYIDKDL